jgi:DNA-binding response OmpR family regulator
MAGYWTADSAVVLIAENDEIVAELIALVVEQAGATPLVTYDGEQALALVRERRPALLITESILPGLDGVGLITALRRERRTDLPSILVTSAPRGQAAGSGATAVLAKPFHIATLEVLLARFLTSQPRLRVPRPAPGMTAGALSW